MKSLAEKTGAAKEPAQTVTVRSLLVSWANDQDPWVRQLVSEAILDGKSVTQAQLDAIYETFLREKALAPGPTLSVPKISS